jgi:hypothetical protein
MRTFWMVGICIVAKTTVHRGKRNGMIRKVDGWQLK